MNQSALKKQVEQKRRQLHELNDKIKKTEDLIYQVLNKPGRYDVKGSSSLEKLREEESRLIEFYQPKTGDLAELFQEISGKRKREISRRKAQVEEYEGQIQEINRRNKKLPKIPEMPKNKTPEYINTTLAGMKSSLGGLKAFVEQCRMEITMKLKMTQDSIKKMLQKQVEDAIKDMREMDNQIENIELEKKHKKEDFMTLIKAGQNISKSSGNDLTPVKPNIDPDEFDAMVEEKLKQMKKILVKYDKRLAEYKLDEQIVMSIDIQIDNICKKVDILKEKIALIGEKNKLNFQGKSEEYEKQKLINAKTKIMILFKNALKCYMLKNIYTSVEPLMQKEADAIKEQLDREIHDKSHTVGDTGLTLSDLRKEIIRLEHEIFKVNFEGERYKEECETKRKLAEEQSKANG